MPASSAAAENVGHWSVIAVVGEKPGSAADSPGMIVTDAPNESLPVKRRSTSADAALNVECPDVYSANGGVMNVSGW